MGNGNPSSYRTLADLEHTVRVLAEHFEADAVAIIGAAMGALGTARAQYHLRQSFVFLEANVLTRPEVFIGGAHTKFVDNGALNDDTAKDLIAQQLQALKEWTLRLGG